MPTTYAHWRFGCDCIEKLPQNLQETVHKYRELFDLGVHGPDIFFYDLLHPQIPKYGSRMHNTPARAFFENAIKVYKDNNEDKEAMMSYILGFLSHFTLDSQCHGYIDRKKEVSGFSHNKVESEYDGHLMILDGKPINLTDRAESLKPDHFTAKVMTRFFSLDEETILRTTRWQHMIIKALVCKNNFKRNLLISIFNLLKLMNYRDLIVQVDQLKECEDSNQRLDKLRANALILYPELVDDLLDSINNNKELPAYFDHDFEPWPDYQSIPVYELKKESEYKPELRK